jgi:hypothetical protein
VRQRRGGGYLNNESRWESTVEGNVLRGVRERGEEEEGGGTMIGAARSADAPSRRREGRGEVQFEI